MSMTLVALATEVARAIGGQNSPSTIDLATIAVKQSINDWNNAKNWNFALRDNSGGFTVLLANWTGSVTSINAPSTGAFDSVNVGLTISGTNIPASTTVTAVTYGSDNTVASITISQATSGTGTNVTLTFGGYIPIAVGTQDYNLPLDFRAPYAAYLRTAKRAINHIKWRNYLKVRADITATGPTDGYTLYHPAAAVNQNYGQYRLRIIDVPGQADSLLLSYYSRLDPDATTVAIPEDYLYNLIEYAVWRFVLRKNSEDSRLPQLEASAKGALSAAMVDDEATNTEDEDFGLQSQMDAWDGTRPLFRNGEFWPLYP